MTKVERRVYHKIWRDKNKEKIRGYYKKYYENSSNKVKQYIEDNKEKIKAYQEEYREINKDKLRDNKKEYYKNNKNREKMRTKKWQKENPEKVEKYNMEYQKEHREEININKRKWSKDRRKNDIQWNIKRRLSSGFNSAIRVYKEEDRFVISRNKNLDYRAIIEHLKPFPENIEEYHIDHIIPQAFFDLINKEQLIKCWNPINFQWLKCNDNEIKNDNINFDKYPEQKEVWDALKLKPKGL